VSQTAFVAMFAPRAGVLIAFADSLSVRTPVAGTASVHGLYDIWTPMVERASRRVPQHLQAGMPDLSLKLQQRKPIQRCASRVRRLSTVTLGAAHNLLQAEG
jgi:hypothetical protein